MMNISTRAAQIIILVMAAALTIAIMGCDGDGDEAPEAASPTGEVTATITAEAKVTPEPSPSPTPTPEVEEPSATVVQRYELPAALRDPAGLPAVDCWFSSISTGRADAFRCMTEDSFIYDPCFLDMDTMVLACPDDPRDDSTTFFAGWGGESGDPDEVSAAAAEPERAWFLVLDAPGGPTCRFLTGATMVLPGDARMDFDCAGPCTSPEPADGEDLAISCYPGVDPDWTEEEMLSVETQHTVTEAWY
jgi:hypothetical protein